MLEKYEVCCGLFHGFDWSRWTAGTPHERLGLLARGAGAHPGAGGRQGAAAARRSRSCRRRSRWPCRTTEALRDPRRRRLLPGRPVGPGQERGRASARPTRSSTTPSGRSCRRRSSSDEVIDIFAAAGLKKPDISILSDEFLAEVRGMPQRNLAVELLRKLLTGEIKTRVAAERRPGALLRGDAGAGRAQVPEPRHRDGPGHRGADRPGQGDARRPTRAARSWA